MRISAAVTLYNPNKEVISNLFRTAILFNKIYVYDNSSNNSSYYQDVIKCDNIKYYFNGKNDGLPIAFNLMMEEAIRDRNDYLCTLDQDSRMSKQIVEGIKKYINTHSMNNIAIVAPFPYEERVRTPAELIDRQVAWVICSGAFLNLAIIKSRALRYDSAYFIDRFDEDFSTQIIKKGLKIIRLDYLQMPHACGEQGSHNALRHYYIFRNRFYYNDKFFKPYKAWLLSSIQSIRHIFLIITGENGDKICKLRAFKIARDDYKKGKMGEISIQSLNRI